MELRLRSERLALLVAELVVGAERCSFAASSSLFVQIVAQQRSLCDGHSCARATGDDEAARSNCESHGGIAESSRVQAVAFRKKS